MTAQPSASLSDFSANGSQPANLPTEIFKQLRDHDTEAKIIQSTVEIIYQALKCDRVVIYSMQPDSLCKITAESVTPGYGQLINRVIKDVCFETDYIDKYQKGRVRAINDIDDSNIANCHLESLREIDVKANLVVPMINEDSSLYGLLVMHQCAKPRQWKQSEVEFVLEMANWTVDRLSRCREHANRAAQLDSNEQARTLITGITRKIHAASSFEDVLQLGVNKAQDILNCDRVVIYCLQSQEMGKIIAEATLPALAPILNSVIKDPCFEYSFINQYEQGRVRAIENIHEAGMSQCYVDNLAKIGVKSNLIAPISWDNGKIYGLLVAHQCFAFREWHNSEIEYFKEIAFHTGLSLTKAELRKQSKAGSINLNYLDTIKESVQLAQSKTQRIMQPLQGAGQNLTEANNLHRLVEREINLINQNGAAQTKKDIKMIQIMTKKLAAVTSNLKRSLYAINSSKNEVNGILEQTIADIVTRKLIDDDV